MHLGDTVDTYHTLVIFPCDGAPAGFAVDVEDGVMFIVAIGETDDTNENPEPIVTGCREGTLEARFDIGDFSCEVPIPSDPDEDYSVDLLEFTLSDDAVKHSSDSVISLDKLAALLHQAQRHNRGLSDEDTLKIVIVVVPINNTDDPNYEGFRPTFARINSVEVDVNEVRCFGIFLDPPLEGCDFMLQEVSVDRGSGPQTVLHVTVLTWHQPTLSAPDDSEE
jgi:hypothetical protein